MILKISYSNISTFMLCPRKWKLRYIDKLDDRSDSIDSIFGTSIHEAVQEFLKFYYSSSNRLVFEDREETLKKYIDVFLDKMASEFKLKEFLTDNTTLLTYVNYGIDIIIEFIKKVQKHFPKQNMLLYGIELELNLNDDWLGLTVFRGFIDLIIKDKKNLTYRVIDLKTSMRGWTDNQKKDLTKRMQLILYKYFLSKKLDIPMEKIEVEFFILKKMIFLNTMYPMSRIQKFVPPNSNITVKRTINTVKLTFLQMKQLELGGAEGLMNTKNCKYCPFILREDLCDRNKKKKK